MKKYIKFNKKIICMILIFSFVFSSAIFAYSTSNYKPKYGITTSIVNFRNAANLNSSSKVKTLPKDTKLKLVGEISNFYIVQLQNDQVGLVSKDFVKEQGNSLEGAKVYESVQKYFATVNDNNTNLRSGPGTNFTSYGKLNSGEKIEVIGKIDDFNLVVTNDNKVGMIRSDLISKYVESGGNLPQSQTNVSSEAKIVLDLINKARKENGLPALEVDSLLNATAQSKAADMVKNNYFSHTSPTYGSPFEMMQKAGISYKTAGENIAGNSSLEDAVNSWLNSESHRKNILSNAYNYIGIGVETSKTYGYVIVAMFIGR